jgi:hypothetical protein
MNKDILTTLIIINIICLISVHMTEWEHSVV